MPNHNFIAIETAMANELRTMRRSDDGLVPRRQIVEPDGGAPCRHCLKEAAPGDAVVLTTLCPFAGTGPYNERGPIFLHAGLCSRPEPSPVIPEIVARRLVVIRAYNADEDIIDADITEGRDARRLIERLLAHDEAAFLHVRTARYGCYLCRVERVC
jgi:hypothetical protein